MEPDFSGWATKPNLVCTDGRTIKTDAFKHMDGQKVPLVWSHDHKSPERILGHVMLEAKDGGLRCHGFFNDTPWGVATKMVVQHKDVDALSIYANKLVQRGMDVYHGFVKEVSMAIAGANPEAKIDFVNIAHADGYEELEDEAIIHTAFGLEIPVQHAAAGETLQDIYDSLSDKQKDVVNFIIGAALSGSSDTAAQADDDDDEEVIEHKDKEGSTDVTKNVFDQSNGGSGTAEKHVLSHADTESIFKMAKRQGQTLKSAVEDYALAHGIENLDILFPDARNITGTPEFIKRQTEWVAGVLNGVSKTPFAAIKTLLADITQDEARAKGYITGTLKKEEWFSVTKRSTRATTIYKKQKLDRDNIIDITDFDVVIFVKGEMRLMLEEEIAISILMGDGRAIDDADKVKDPAGVQDGQGIRSIVNDHPMYTTTVNVQLDAMAPDYNDIVEKFLLSRQSLKGTGTPTLYTTWNTKARMLLAKDTYGRKLYNSESDLTASLMVNAIVAVEAMERDSTLVGIFVNLQDYNVGADKGGEVNLFDDFDLNYNTYTYLIETRISGALVKYKSAMVMRFIDPTYTKVTPAPPTFVKSTGVVTIVATTHVTYKDADTGATLSTGAQTALDPGETMNVVAIPAATYFVDDSNVSNWSFTRPHA